MNAGKIYGKVIYFELFGENYVEIITTGLYFSFTLLIIKVF
jgi:hypothetical protein